MFNVKAKSYYVLPLNEIPMVLLMSNAELAIRSISGHLFKFLDGAQEQDYLVGTKHSSIHSSILATSLDILTLLHTAWWTEPSSPCEYI